MAAAEVDLRPPAEEDLPADVGDVGAVPAGGSLAHHLGAPALAPPGVGRDPELVLSARPQSRHPVGGDPGHLVAGVAPLPAVLHLPHVDVVVDDHAVWLAGRQPGDDDRVLPVHHHLDAGGRPGDCKQQG